MQILLLSLFIAIILPIVAKLPLAMAMIKDNGYNNRYPRDQQKSLVGFGARAKAAHENSFEALLMFAPGVLAAISVNSVSESTQWFAIAFISARLGYMVMYWMDFDKLRSTFWSVGFVCSVAIMWQAVATTF